MITWLVICSGCIVTRAAYPSAMSAADVRIDLMRQWGFPSAIAVRQS